MQHHNSVSYHIQCHIPWPVVDRLTEDHRADHGRTCLSSKSQFLALLIGQLAEAAIKACTTTSEPKFGPDRRWPMPTINDPSGLTPTLGTLDFWLR